MIKITITGPAKSGKSILASYIGNLLLPLGDQVVINDVSPRNSKFLPIAPMTNIFKGTTINIVVK